MSNTQQMLSIASLIFLSQLILNYYRASGSQEAALLTNEAIIAASDISKGIIEEIQTRAFDEKTTTQSIAVLDSLSVTLGKESGETISTNFDDVDDYNNYQRVETLPKLGAFNILVKVYYLNNMSPNSITSSKRFNKRIDVAIFNSYLTDTLKSNYIISY